MTTYTIYLAHPAAVDNAVGFAAPVASGLSLDSTTTGTGASKSLLDEYVGSTDAIKIGKLLADLQRGDKYGRKWVASSDALTTVIQALL